MATNRSTRPPWALFAERSFLSLGGSTPASTSLRLRMAWIVFQDQMGNLVIVDPERPRPLGAGRKIERPPTIYFATSNEEFEAVAEAMLPVLEQNLVGGVRQMKLIDRVRKVRELLSRWGPASSNDRLPKVKSAA